MLFAAQVGDLFASERSSHEGYTEIFTAQFATLSRVELPITNNTQKFFSKFSFQCSGGWSWRLSLNLSQSRKSQFLHKMGQFLNLFSFPSNISNCSSSSFSEILSNSPCLTQTNLHFASFLFQIFKKKVWVFSLSLHISCFELCFLGLVFCY